MPCNAATGGGDLLNALACSSLLGALKGPMCNEEAEEGFAVRRPARDVEVRGASFDLRKRRSRKRGFFSLEPSSGHVNRMDAREVFGLGRLVNIFRKRSPEVAQASSGVGQGEDPRSDSAATMPVGDESDLEGQD